MIARRCFTKSWIRGKHNEIKADPILIERAIYAFELLGGLIENGLRLLFKGGTGLMILIPLLKRLSIDLDIITDQKGATLTKVFSSIIREGIFNRWEEDVRLSALLMPKKHFKFFYSSPSANSELYVLLDILQMTSPYPETIKKQIILPLFEVEKKVEVEMPTINCLAGDKLTAFAPTTIGIPYGKGKSMEIMKQLFDLGLLFEYIDDLQMVSQTYKRIAQIEASYRKVNSSIDEFLTDSIKTAFQLCQLDFSGSVENDYTKELRDGLTGIKSHIIGGKYSLLRAKEDAAKIAGLASLIKGNRLDIDLVKLRQNRSRVELIKDVYLPEKFSILNKLKSISPESFYLWCVISGVVKTN